MKTAKTLTAYLIVMLLLSGQAWGQTASPGKTATQQGKNLPATLKNINPDSLKAQSQNKAQPIKKSDVPEIPLKNSRITYDYTNFDFGNVPPGTKITHDFPVKNTGADTLIITKIKAG